MFEFYGQLPYPDNGITYDSARHSKSEIALIMHNKSKQKMCCAVNPFMPNALFYTNFLNQSTSNRMGVWLIFIIAMHYRNSCI